MSRFNLGNAIGTPKPPVCEKLMKDHLVDKARPANGRTFRSYNSILRWQPPPYYKRQAGVVRENWPNQMSPPWLVCVDAETGIVQGLYETRQTAAAIEGISYDTIKTVANTGRVHNGWIWRTALDEEYAFWVPCTPPEELE